MSEQPEVIDGEIADDSYLPATVTAPLPTTLFRTDDPDEILARATRTANALSQVVRRQGLLVKIGQGEHAKVEAWTMLGSLLGVFPACVWTRKLEDGWEARVEARTRDGFVVGAAEAECLYSEKTWKNRDDYALRSMAQTRATSKALRQPLGFVMTLAGFDPTPAEEMPRSGDRTSPAQGPRGGEKSTASKEAQADTGGASTTEDEAVGVTFANAKQVTLLWTTVRGRGVDVEEFRRLLIEITGQGSSKAIPAAKFERVLDAVREAPVEFQFKPPPGAVPA